eukprot:COSAG06_NODE_46627_length_345_cov_1.052846_1_plen_108_part_01
MQAAYWGHVETAAELARLERLERLTPAGAQQSVAPACVVLDASPVPWDSENSVSIICSAPEFSEPFDGWVRLGAAADDPDKSKDQVMVGLFQICDAFSGHVKFGYDWG